MLTEHRLFPVRIVMTCTCGWRMREFTADNLGGLEWIQIAGAQSHGAERPDCESRPVAMVPTEEEVPSG